VSIGLAIFASVVLILAVYHTGFRKVVLWTGGIALALAVLCVVVYFAHDWYATRKAEAQKKIEDAKAAQERKAGTDACLKRLGAPTGTPKTLPAMFFDVVAACTVAPDEDGPWTTYRTQDGLDKATENNKYLTLKEGRVTLVAQRPCPDSLPVGVALDEPCVFSGRAIFMYRREMCVGKIAANGDCGTSPPAGYSSAIQLCPYGLPVITHGDCTPWGDVDTAKEQAKLAEYRAGNGH
jgi:hypothetical protein